MSATELPCGHTKLFADDLRGPKHIEPCLWCENHRLRNEIMAITFERDALKSGGDNNSVSGGLTKRELFAAMAMQGLCANQAWEMNHATRQTAIEAVGYAEALLQELAK